MADSMMDMGRVIPQGPTVQSTPATTNSLADVAALLLPALVGSQMKHYTPNGVEKGGMLGALQGAGMGAEALDQQRVRAQKYQDAQGEAEYRQALTQQAQQNAEQMRLKDDELTRQLADRGKFEEDLTPEEKQRFRADPEGFLKERRLDAHRPDLVKILKVATKGTIPDEVLMSLPSEMLVDSAEKALQAGSQGEPPKLMEIPLGDGKTAKILTYPGTKLQPTVLDKGQPDKEAQPKIRKDFDRATGKYQDVGVDPATGKELWRRDAGEQQLSAPEREALRFEKVAVMQADRLMGSLAKVDPKDVVTMSKEAWKYQNPQKAGIAGQLTGGMIGGFDPKYVDIFSNMGQLEAVLQRALTGGRVAKGLYDRLIKHVPETGDPPQIIADKLASLASEKGTMKEMIDVIQGENKYYDRLAPGASESPKAASSPAKFDSMEAFKKAHPGVELEPVE